MGDGKKFFHYSDWRSSVKCSRDWSKKCLMDGTTAKLLVESMITGPSKNIRERCSYDGTVVRTNMLSLFLRTFLSLSLQEVLELQDLKRGTHT